MITCVLPGNHVLLRECLRVALESRKHFTVFSDFEDARVACEHALSIQADIVLMSCDLKGSCPYEATRWLRRADPRIKVLFADNQVSAGRFHRAIECGASGYLEKSCTCQELVVAIERICRGEEYFPNRFDLAISAINKFTPREREVLKLLVEGNTAKEIAIMLDISTATVTTHRYNIMKRIQAKNRVELVMYAISNNIVEVPVAA